ncbi:hypothetical protein LXL04_009448 [Taraxacum kok-saghyz]
MELEVVEMAGGDGLTAPMVPHNNSPVQMRTIIGFENEGTNLGHLIYFAADQFSVAGALPSAQHI